MGKLLFGVDAPIVVPVTVDLLVGGKPHQIKFEAEFKRISRSLAIKEQKRLNKLVREFRKASAAAANNPDDDAAQDRADAAADEINQFNDRLIRKRLIGWSGLTGADGDELSYSEEALEEMLDHLAYFEALRDAMALATGKVIEDAEKN